MNIRGLYVGCTGHQHVGGPNPLGLHPVLAELGWFNFFEMVDTFREADPRLTNAVMLRLPFGIEYDHPDGGRTTCRRIDRATKCRSRAATFQSFAEDYPKLADSFESSMRTWIQASDVDVMVYTAAASIDSTIAEIIDTIGAPLLNLANDEGVEIALDTSSPGGPRGVQRTTTEIIAAIQWPYKGLSVWVEPTPPADVGGDEWSPFRVESCAVATGDPATGRFDYMLKAPHRFTFAKRTRTAVMVNGREDESNAERFERIERYVSQDEFNVRVYYSTRGIEDAKGGAA